jgi:hypothetical protein
MCATAPKEKLRAFRQGDVNSWYEEILAASPRRSWKNQIWRTPSSPQKPASQPLTAQEDSVWLTGLKACEADPLIFLLGDRFRVPSAQEWRRFNQRLNETALDKVRLKKLVAGQDWHPAASYFFAQLLRSNSLLTWSQMTLMDIGLAEIALDCDGLFQNIQYVGLGRVSGTLWNPRTGVPYPQDRRDARFGIRPFQTLN